MTLYRFNSRVRPRCGVAGDLGDGGREVSIVFSSSSDSKPKSEVTWGATVVMAFGAARSGSRLGSSVARPGLGERSAVHNFFVAFYVTANSARFFKRGRGGAFLSCFVEFGC